MDSSKKFTVINSQANIDGQYGASQIIYADDISDGYHTISELYDHRRALTVALTKFIELYKMYFDSQGELRAFRSLRHKDGTMFDGYFIVGIGYYVDQVDDFVSKITYHYDLIYWDQFDHCVTLERAPEYDGHTGQDVIERLLKL